MKSFFNLLFIKTFAGLVFTVGGFEEQEYTQMIASIHGLGGKIVGKNYLGTPDFGVVPKLGGELKLSEVKEVVTELFIVSITLQNQI